MKANEFVKKHGISAASELVNESEWSIKQLALATTTSMLDLKRLVESHELVERVIADHNKIFKECQIDIHGLKSFVKKNPRIYPKRLKQAIADVESCMEVSSESN